MIRHIVEARVDRYWTHIRLDCGHERSLGGRIFPNGDRADIPSKLLGREYDCRDGLCGDPAQGPARRWFR